MKFNEYAVQQKVGKGIYTPINHPQHNHIVYIFDSGILEYNFKFLKDI